MIRSEMRRGYGVKLIASIYGGEIRETLYTPEHCRDAALALANAIYDLVEFGGGDTLMVSPLIDYLEGEE